MSDNAYVTFTNTIDDMVAFNMYHFAHSPTTRRIRFWSTWGMAVIIVLIGAATSLLQGNPRNLVFVALWAAIYLAFTIPYSRWAVRKRVRKIVSEGKNPGFLSESTLRATNDGICGSSEVSEGKILWSGIERIAENDDYLFLYTGAVMAFVIPKGRIDAGDLAAFTDELRRNVNPSA